MALLTRIWPLMQKVLFEDATDPTKQAELDLTGITTGTKRTYTLPDGNGTFLLAGDALPWANVTGTPTTLAGYGIADGATSAYVDARTPQVTSSTTAPTSPATGDIWVDMT